MGEPGSACSGVIGLTGIPHSVGSGKVVHYSGWRKFTLAAGSERPIPVHLLRGVVPRLEEVHWLKVRARVILRAGEDTAKDIVLRWKPSARQRPERPAAASALAAVRPSTCGPATGKTLLANSGGRIYTPPQKAVTQPGETVIYACLNSLSRPVRLSPTWTKKEDGGKRHYQSMWKPFALQAPWMAGVGYTRYGVDVSHVSIRAVNLRTGIVKECPAWVNVAHPGGKVSGIALKRNGSLAWVGVPGGFQPHISRVAVCDSEGERMLDSDEGIDLHSLTLHGSMLTWTDSGVTHTASLR